MSTRTNLMADAQSTSMPHDRCFDTPSTHPSAHSTTRNGRLSGTWVGRSVFQTLQFMRASITNGLTQGPKEREDPELDVRATYYILQRSHYLHVYAKPEAQPSKRIAKFDMLKPKKRQSFVDVRRKTAEHYPLPQSPPKHKSLLRVQGLCNGGHERQRAKKLAHAKSSALRE